ncbi:hypothetical protein COO60DRAFT_1704350 [Scenedesmus sp. NREL 46B-D3]|nr:hypothetical protein COO60DRAFT_1704350 [Scenedesmus sp. NREL 46B-D3]
MGRSVSSGSAAASWQSAQPSDNLATSCVLGSVHSSRRRLNCWPKQPLLLGPQHLAQHNFTISAICRPLFESLLFARLSLLLGRNWQKALQVVDQNEVECYIGENSRRHIFQVRGKSGVYITFAKTYCSCQAHYYEVVCKSEAPYCKHQLAARLAFALKRCPVTVVPDSAIAQFLLDS